MTGPARPGHRTQSPQSHHSGRRAGTRRPLRCVATLYGRAIDARQPDPVLGDQTALDAVNRIDYDFGRFKMSPDMALTVALRALILDRMTE